jgi:hypothetical protein
MADGEFRRYTTTGLLDAASLNQTVSSLPCLVYIGGDQFLGLTGDSLYQYDRVDDSWTLVTTLAQSFPDAALAFDYGTLHATTSSSDQLFKIDLTSYAITALGDRGSSSGGGLATFCKSSAIVCAAEMIMSCEIGVRIGGAMNAAPYVVTADAADINQALSSDYTVVVTYDDDYGLDASTFDIGDIQLTGECPARAGQRYATHIHVCYAKDRPQR